MHGVGELTCLQLDEGGFRKVVDALLPALATRRELLVLASERDKAQPRRSSLTSLQLFCAYDDSLD